MEDNAAGSACRIHYVRRRCTAKVTETELFAAYRQYYRKIQLILALALIGILVTALGVLVQGAADISIRTALQAVLKGVTGTPDTWTAQDKIVLLIRLPRLLMAMTTGAMLAIAGAVMQSITRNPLVSPFTIGISAAATFGASLYLLFGYMLGGVSEIGVMGGAFVMSTICAAGVYALSQKVGTGATALVLIGIGANYIFSAGTSILQFFAEEHKLAMIVNWTFGSFTGADWGQIAVMLPAALLGGMVLQLYAQRLNAMIAGDDDVLQTLGTNPERLRKRVGLTAVFVTSITICFTGIIGFVGLIAPHIARMLVGNQHHYLLPFSALLGAWLVLLADAVGHWILAPVVLPVGVVIAFVGVPLFMHLILRGRGQQWE